MRAAGDWELAASGPALAVAGRALVRVAGQEAAEEQVARVLAVAARAQARVAEEQAVRAVRDLVAGRVEGPGKRPHQEDGRLPRRCCAGPWAVRGAYQEFLAHQEKGAAVFRWQKRMCDR